MRTQRTGIQRVCQECGKDFIASRDCATRTSKYCSKECGWAVQKRKAAEATPSADELFRLHHTEGISVDGVGKHYGKSAAWAKAALARRGVPERGTKTGREIACEVCGNTFYASGSVVARGRRFCSNACKGKGMPAPSKDPEARRKISESKMGSKNAAWRGVDTEGSIYQVFNVRLKGETCCRNCGAEATAVLPLHLHHAVPRSMCKAGRRDLRNGITLCHACHMGWHYRTKTIYRDLFTEAEWSFISSLELLGQNITAWLEDRYPKRRPLTLFEGEAA
jgi:hypothetical protein